MEHEARNASITATCMVVAMWGSKQSKAGVRKGWSRGTLNRTKSGRSSRWKNH